MKVTTINKNIKLLSNSVERGEYFPKSVVNFDGKEKDFYSWFFPNNNYPEFIISEISKGITLDSVIWEDTIYKTGSGFSSANKTFEDFINKEKINNTEYFKDVFKEVNDNYNKLGNCFNEITVNEEGQLISINTIQPQKCRITKTNYVIINADWLNFKKENSKKLPLYPKFKAVINNGIKLYKSVLHIKNNPIGFDHYGINEKLKAALKLNEKEYRRNNWQLSQIKNGFSKDFFLVTDFDLTSREKKKAQDKLKLKGGDENAGGIEVIESENGKLVEAKQSHEFDFNKDDTTAQIFLKMGFPPSLVGIKSGSAFSVEQVESDYDQYLPKIEEQQMFLLNQFKEIFANHTVLDTTDWQVVNTPPSIVIQRYLPYMNETQKNRVIENKLNKYGI